MAATAIPVSALVAMVTAPVPGDGLKAHAETGGSFPSLLEGLVAVDAAAAGAEAAGAMRPQAKGTESAPAGELQALVRLLAADGTKLAPGTKVEHPLLSNAKTPCIKEDAAAPVAAEPLEKKLAAEVVAAELPVSQEVEAEKAAPDCDVPVAEMAIPIAAQQVVAPAAAAQPAPVAKTPGTETPTVDTKATAVELESIKLESIESESTKSESTKSGSTKSESNKSRSNQSRSNQSESIELEPDTPEQVKPEPATIEAVDIEGLAPDSAPHVASSEIREPQRLAHYAVHHAAHQEAPKKRLAAAPELPGEPGPAVEMGPRSTERPPSPEIVRVPAPAAQTVERPAPAPRLARPEKEKRVEHLAAAPIKEKTVSEAKAADIPVAPAAPELPLVDLPLPAPDSPDVSPALPTVAPQAPAPPVAAPPTAPPAASPHGEARQALPVRRAVRSAIEQILPFRPPVTGTEPAKEVRDVEATDSQPALILDEPAIVPPGQPSPRANAPEHQPIPAAPDTKVRAISVAAPDRGELVFEAKVQTAVQTPPVTSALSAAHAILQDAPARYPLRMASQAPAVEEEKTPVPQKSESGDQAAAEHDRKPDTKERVRSVPAVEPKAEIPQGTPAPKFGSPATTTPAGTREETITEPAPEAAAAEARETVKSDGKPEIPASAAREIKLEVSGGDHRVEVRLSERAGEVRVSVRTPDSHLAGELRENLPDLATRLADNGLRSEIWRPAASHSSEWRHTAEPQPGNPSQDGDAQQRGQGGKRDEGEPRQARQQVQEPRNQKEKGRDFAWLMSSLR